MGFIAPIIAAVSSGFGLFQQIKGSRKAAAPPAPPPPVKPPPRVTEGEAKEKATADVGRRRRISLLSGGQTNVTKGQATVGESQLGRKSLVGA